MRTNLKQTNALISKKTLTVKESESVAAGSSAWVGGPPKATSNTEEPITPPVYTKSGG